MDNSVDYYQVQSMAEEAARNAKYDAIREVEEMLRIDRQDNRDSHQDIRDGIAELADRLWKIEVRLGIRDESGRII